MSLILNGVLGTKIKSWISPDAVNTSSSPSSSTDTSGSSKTANDSSMSSVEIVSERDASHEHVRQGKILSNIKDCMNVIVSASTSSSSEKEEHHEFGADNNNSNCSNNENKNGPVLVPFQTHPNHHPLSICDIPNAYENPEAANEVRENLNTFKELHHEEEPEHSTFSEVPLPIAQPETVNSSTKYDESKAEAEGAKNVALLRVNIYSESDILLDGSIDLEASVPVVEPESLKKKRKSRNENSDFIIQDKKKRRKTIQPYKTREKKKDDKFAQDLQLKSDPQEDLGQPKRMKTRARVNFLCSSDVDGIQLSQNGRKNEHLSSCGDNGNFERRVFSQEQHLSSNPIENAVTLKSQCGHSKMKEDQSLALLSALEYVIEDETSCEHNALVPKGGKVRIVTGDSATTLQSSKKRQRRQIYSMNSAQIMDRVKEMFKNNDSVLLQPCVSARLFACFSLVLEEDRQQQCIKTEVTKDDEKKLPVEKLLNPLLPLLRALVRVEDACLGGLDNNEGLGSDTLNSYFPNATTPSSKELVGCSIKKSAKKRVQFSGFDCSSKIPPVDSITGSQSHQEICILALLEAVEQVKVISCLKDNKDILRESHCQNENEILTASTCRSQQLIPALNAIIDFCRDARDATSTNIVQQCANSVYPDYPPRRIIKALDLYRSDFETLLSAISSTTATSTLSLGNNCTHNMDSPFRNGVTHIERKLAEFVGQAIRFHLRMMLNPPLSPTHSEHGDIGIHNLLSMEVPPQARDTAAADGSVSSLFSTALRHISDHLGFDDFLSLPLPQPQQHNETSSSFLLQKENRFCENLENLEKLISPSSPINNTLKLSEDEMNKVFADIDDALSLVQVTNACIFLRDLFHVPGVQSEIHLMDKHDLSDNRRGRCRGWSSCIQRYAGILKAHQVWDVCPQDAHFVFLSCDLNTFIEKIIYLTNILEPIGTKYQAAIKKLESRCRQAGRRRGQKRPFIKQILEVLEEGIDLYNSFPRVFLRH